MGKVNIKQLNVAPASGYVIGSGAGGVPTWKLEVTSVAWNQITGNQALVNLSGFTNDSGFITLGSLSAGTGISYDNLTGVITNSDPSSNITASLGIFKSGNDIRLGGPNISPTSMNMGNNARWSINGLTDTGLTGTLRVFSTSRNIVSAVIPTGSRPESTYSNGITFTGTDVDVITPSSAVPFGVSGAVTFIDNGGSKNFGSNIHLASQSGYINMVSIKSDGAIKPSLSCYNGYNFISLRTTDAIRSQNGVNLILTRINSTGTVQNQNGYTIGFNSTSGLRGNSGNIGFGVYYHNIASTGSGNPINSTIMPFLENNGEFAFYDQTGWNNYFKGSLGLGNPIPVSKLDVTGDINTTVGFKISGAATLGNYLRGDGTNFVSSALTASDLALNSITDGLIRQSAGLSVIGRSTNSTGNVADITAGTDLHVLRRSGTSIGFGLLTGGSISATNNQLFYGVGGVAGQSANMTYDGTTATFTSGFSSVSNITNGVNFTGTSTAVANAAYGVRYAQILTANASINHSITGVQFSPTLVASSNFNFLYGAQLDPTFTVGAFTGVTTIPLQIIERSTSGQTIRLQNATAVATNGILLADNVNGQRVSMYYIGSTGQATYNLNGASSNTFNYSSVNLQIQNAFVTRATYFHNTGYYSHTPASSSITSGTGSSHSINQAFDPTSGTGVHNWLDLNGTINQTGGANGITRGLYVNNTVTAAADYRAIETTAGKTILGGSTGALLVGSGTLAASAKVEIQSTTQGFLPPRMTATQGSAIASPAEGLMIYVTDTNGTFTTKGWWGYNGAAWQQL